MTSATGRTRDLPTYMLVERVAADLLEAMQHPETAHQTLRAGAKFLRELSRRTDATLEFMDEYVPIDLHEDLLLAWTIADHGDIGPFDD